MSRPRFLADNDFNEHVLEGLLRLEPAVQVLRVREIGLARAPDAEVLAYAAAEGWIVLSHDVSTMTAAAYARVAAAEPMAGLFVTAQQAALAPVIDSLLVAWAASEAEEWQNLVRYLPF
jgi:hypothetical protein